jgi:hypothetical protein
MRFRNTLILIVALVLLGGYIYFVEMHQPPAEEVEETELQLWQLDSDSIVRLTVTDNKEDKRTELVKEGGTWRMAAPSEEEVDEPKVKRAVERIEKLEARRKLGEQPGDLSVFGLDKPAFTVRVELTGGDEEVLQVGDLNPQRTAYYVQHEGDPAVYLVTSFTIEELKRLVEQPPKKPTLTPTVTHTPEVTPTPEATATPAETPGATPAATPSD